MLSGAMARRPSSASTPNDFPVQIRPRGLPVDEDDHRTIRRAGVHVVHPDRGDAVGLHLHVVRFERVTRQVGESFVGSSQHAHCNAPSAISWPPTTLARSLLPRGSGCLIVGFGCLLGPASDRWRCRGSGAGRGAVLPGVRVDGAGVVVGESFTVVRVVWRDRLARFGVAWIERYLSVCGVSVEALHDRGDMSLLEELMDDFMALLASFSGRFYQLRSKRNQQRLLDAASERLGQ
jgi:hypothetical protein